MTMQRWRAAAQAARLIDSGGEVRQTIFAEMSALASRTGALNLGQGFPDSDGPAAMLQAAQEAIAAGRNQYPSGAGVPELRTAVAAHQQRHYGQELDPDGQILITHGATEGIAASILALAGPGQEVLTLEPFYDSYAAVIAMSGATHTTAPLVPTDDGFRIDAQALRAAFSDRTAVVLLNSPHNPTGAVLTTAELELIAELAKRHEAIVVTDEVYEHLVFDDRVHTPIATLPSMAGRTLTISSAGKTFSVTGWKIGWVSGPAELITAVQTVKQFLTYAGGAPLQPAVATALDLETTAGPEATWVQDLRRSLAQRRDLLCAGLQQAGFEVVRPQGTYFVIARAEHLLARTGLPDAGQLARELPQLAGVGTVPVSAFTTPGSAADTALATSVRFTFVKAEPMLRQALDRLRGLSGS